jgi:hypothetical protein
VPGIDSIPSQVATASQFAINAEGRIDLVPDPPIADGSQREIYSEVRHKALKLSALGHNQLADLSEPVDRFLAAAPERFDDASITCLWSRGNTLRLRLKAHETATASVDPTDPARLTPLVARMLGDVVETFNVFIVGDPKGCELDHIRLGPQDRAAAQAVVDAAAPIVEAINAWKGLATAPAVEALTDPFEAARHAPAGIDGDQAIDLAQRTSKNIVLEVLRGASAYICKEPGLAWRGFRDGYYRAAGAAAFVATSGAAGAAVYYYGPQVAAFVVRNADVLRAFVEQAFHNPALIRIIKMVSETAPPI